MKCNIIEVNQGLTTGGGPYIKTFISIRIRDGASQHNSGITFSFEKLIPDVRPCIVAQ